MSERNEGRRYSDAERCRRNGWKVGDRLAGDEGYGPTIIEITAIGERDILAKAIARDGKREAYYREGYWTLACRKWRRITKYQAEDRR